MQIQVLYLLAVHAAVVLLACLAAYGWVRRRASGLTMVAVAVTTALWALAGATMALLPPESARPLFSLKYTLLGLSNISMFLFVARHTGYWRSTSWPGAAAFLAIPLVSHVAAWFDGAGVLQSVTFTTAHELTRTLRITFGPLYVVNTAFHFSLVLTSLGFAVQFMRRGGLERGQGLAIFVAQLVPAITNVLMIAGFVPREFDLMPIGQGLAAAALFWGVFRYRMLDVAPVARHALVDALGDGILIVDGRQCVVDLNRRMVEVLGIARSAAVGRRLDTLSIAEPLRRATASALTPPTASASPPSDSLSIRDRVYDVRTVAVGQTAARVLVLHDVTQRQHLEDEQRRLITDLQAALAQVKTLTGLLPICAGCKKIKDESDTWQPMERFIRARTDAEFSHGMCPECANRWYPQFAPPGSGPASTVS